MDGLTFEEVLVDVELYGLGKNIEISSGEVVLGWFLIGWKEKVEE